MTDREKKSGRWKHKKIEYVENEKSFSDEIKNIFLTSYHMVEIKNFLKNRTQALI